MSTAPPSAALPSRFQIQAKLDEISAVARGPDLTFALQFIDLDRFKQVNDEAGHDVGDAVLREMANRFTACMRTGDTVARLGADEFLVIQPSDQGQANSPLPRISRSVSTGRTTG